MTGREEPEMWPIVMLGPMTRTASAWPNWPRRTRKPGTVPSTATGSRNAQFASRASPSTLSIESWGSGGSGRPQISARPGSRPKSIVAQVVRRRAAGARPWRPPYLVRGDARGPRSGTCRGSASVGEIAAARVSTTPGGSCPAAVTWILTANAFCVSRREKSLKARSASTANASGASFWRP